MNTLKTTDQTPPANDAGVPPAPPEAPATSVRVAGREVFIRSGYVKVKLGGELPEGVEVWRDPGRPAGVGFAGRRAKPDWNYRFGSEEVFRTFVAKWVDGLRVRETAKAERRAAAAAPHGCQVGDVFRSCWGYEQTNVDFWQIVALRGRTQAVVRRIAADVVATAAMSGVCTPIPNRFLDEARHPARVVRLCAAEPPRFKVESFANAYRMTPTVEVGGVRVFEATDWSSYA